MSTKMKTVLIVVVLLVGIGVINYVAQMDPTQLAERGVGRDPHSHGHDHEGEEEPPMAPEDLYRPFGPEDAEVTITVLTRDEVELRNVLRPMLAEMASDYEGHVRVEFIEKDTEEYDRLVNEAAAGTPAGLLINGEMVKQVPEAPFGVVTFAGSPAFDDWTSHDVRLAVEHELEAKGVEFTPQAEHDHSETGGAHSHEGHAHSHGHEH